MDKLWTFIGASVWAPTTCECSGYDCECVEPNYGPRVVKVRDNRGHAIAAYGHTETGWPFITCECGWYNFAPNYYNHLDDLNLPMVDQFS